MATKVTGLFKWSNIEVYLPSSSLGAAAGLAFLCAATGEPGDVEAASAEAAIMI